MADDWRPGDLALCVQRGKVCKDCGGRKTGPRLTLWHIYTVSDVLKLGGEIALELEGMPQGRVACRGSRMHQGYRASFFRKIRPLTDEEKREALADIAVPLLHDAMPVTRAQPLPTGGE